MKPGLDPGRAFELEITVTPDMCPRFDAEPVHPVCATWTVVHYMEVAGRRLLEPHLEEHEEGIGAHIRVDHVSPAVIGSRVTIRAEVESLVRHRLTTRMLARVGDRTIATGSFVQVVLPKERLRELIQRHTP